MAYGKLAHVAVDQVEADREDDIDAHVHEDELNIRIEKLECGMTRRAKRRRPGGRQQPSARFPSFSLNRPMRMRSSWFISVEFRHSPVISTGVVRSSSTYADLGLPYHAGTEVIMYLHLHLLNRGSAE